MTDNTVASWVEHFLTALFGGGIVGIGTWLKLRAESKKVNAETGSEIVKQAQAVVEMWENIGKNLEERVKRLEDDLEGKAKTIGELERMNAAKDKRIKELEREVKDLQDRIKQLEGGK